MPPRALKKLVTELDSVDELQQWIDKSDQMLIVVDIFEDWCGYCSVMDPTYNRLLIDLDDFESRVKLFALPKSKISDSLREQLPPVPEGCKPMLVVFKHNVVIGKVHGANGPELAGLISENVFPSAEAED
eukprot:gb/GECG01004606.1/.p1 GENE.gb/GECG01004606.1/~~gb/GECG01004606.1/.p1  ORF type:complete len:130 (+),score=17.73 gb/GECG01004606.1/:1-390(+)